jgi:hypothetical protein
MKRLVFVAAFLFCFLGLVKESKATFPVVVVPTNAALAGNFAIDPLTGFAVPVNPFVGVGVGVRPFFAVSPRVAFVPGRTFVGRRAFVPVGRRGFVPVRRGFRRGRGF